MPRYFLFESNYDDTTYIGEVSSLVEAAVKGDHLLMIEGDQPAHWLTLEQNATDIPNQGWHVVLTWEGQDHTPVGPTLEFNLWRYGVPVPEGWTLFFDGVETRLMTNAEAAKISQQQRIAGYASGSQVYFGTASPGWGYGRP